MRSVFGLSDATEDIGQTTPATLPYQDGKRRLLVAYRHQGYGLQRQEDLSV